MGDTEPKIVDLSYVVFGEGTSSKIYYGLLIITSLTSVSISLARVLKWGKNPLIKFFLSFQFFKIILMMLTRFIVQSYILSMAVKSLMFFSVFTNFFRIELQDSQFEELFEMYYRGIHFRPKQLRFTTAALYAPLLLLSFLFLPSLIYTMFLSIRCYGVRNLFSNFMENPVFFPIPGDDKLFLLFSRCKI